MFSAKTLHFALLGLILGAVTGYIFANYRAERPHRPAPPASSPSAPGMPEGHPDVSDEQMITLFEEALKKNPNDMELMVRYGNFLFDREKYPEAVNWYQKVLDQDPNNVNVRTDMGTALWNLKRADEAMSQYKKSLEIDPQHMLTLHNIVVVSIDGKGDIEGAGAVLKTMEQIDPKYQALPSLRKKIEDARAGRNRSR